MDTPFIWEWRTFLDPSVPREDFWGRLPTDDTRRGPLVSRAKTRTDSYFDLDDIEIGLKGRAVRDGTPRWLEIKVRTDHRGGTERWGKILRTNRSSLRGLCHGAHADPQRLTRLIREEPSRGDARLDDWQRRIESRLTAAGTRIIHIWKSRTQVLIARAAETGWDVSVPGDDRTRQALVECTELRLVHAGAAAQPLGWTVCCEHEDREFVVEVAERLFGGLGGNVMGYPEFVIRTRKDLGLASS